MTRKSHVTVELPDHGEFSTTLEAVEQYDGLSRRELARRIAEAYGGTGRASKASYWLAKPKTVLVIVLGGINHPLN